MALARVVTGARLTSNMTGASVLNVQPLTTPMQHPGNVISGLAKGNPPPNDAEAPSI
jgi:hypothetical protein